MRVSDPSRLFCRGQPVGDMTKVECCRDRLVAATMAVELDAGLVESWLGLGLGLQ